MATHSSILAWKNPWTEEPGGQTSMGLHDWACVHEGGGRWVGSNKLVELKKKIVSSLSSYLFRSYSVFYYKVFLVNFSIFVLLLWLFYFLLYFLFGFFFFLTQFCCSMYVLYCTVAPQAGLTMGFPKQEFWSGWPFPFQLFMVKECCWLVLRLILCPETLLFLL